MVRPHVPLGVVVAIASAAQFMVILDTTIVNVALPDMRTALGLSTADQQWVITAYLVTFGGFLLLAARAGDLLGRRRLFIGGLVVFTAASLVGGLSSSGTMLLVARAVQGIGAAALAPGSLSLITSSHTDPHQRSRALAIWAACASSAGVTGLLIGGLLTSGLSWRWVLFVNVPIGAALLLASAAYLVPSVSRHAQRRLDLPGAVLVTAGMATTVFAVSRTVDDGWTSSTVLGALVAAVALLALFVAVERRSTEPLIPLQIFGHLDLRTANAAIACVGVVLTSSSFFMSLYLQQTLGYSPLRTGLAMLPLALTAVSGILVARRAIAVLGPRRVIACGGIVTATGLGWLSWLPTQPAYVEHVLLPSLPIGAGISMLMLPLTIVATTGVDPRDAGLASGLLNVCRQLGGALGLAVLVSVAASVAAHSDASQPAATVHGYHVALLVTAGLSLFAGLIALRIRDHR